MKVIKSESYNKIRNVKAFGPKESKWEYKGHRCSIELDYEEDNIKAYHTVITPEGKALYPDISPYDTDQTTVNMWIDAGYPSRQGVGPLDKKDLQTIIGQKGLQKGLPPKGNNNV